MKSEPELVELLAEVEGIEVTMAEKGFGTRVEIRADEHSGLEVADLERFLDRLAEPQKQPFGSAMSLETRPTSTHKEDPS